MNTQSNNELTNEALNDELKPVDDATPFDQLDKEQQDIFAEAMTRAGLDPSLLK